MHYEYNGWDFSSNIFKLNEFFTLSIPKGTRATHDHFLCCIYSDLRPVPPVEKDGGKVAAWNYWCGSLAVCDEAVGAMLWLQGLSNPLDLHRCRCSQPKRENQCVSHSGTYSCCDRSDISLSIFPPSTTRKSARLSKKLNFTKQNK